MKMKVLLVVALLSDVSLVSAPVAAAHDLAKTSVAATFLEGKYAIDIRTDPQLLLMQLGGVVDSGGSPNGGAAWRWRTAFEGRQGRLRRAVGVRFDGHLIEPTMTLSFVGAPASPEVVIHLAGNIPEGATAFRWSYALLYTPYALTERRGADGAITTEWLTGGQQSAPFPLGRDVSAPSRVRAIERYVELGFTHIVPAGADHILFVLGLCLLSRRLRPLLSQVSAFTVAHSVTLALSMYGVVSAPARVVEPLIAASIALVAVENLFTSELKPWRIVLVFCFGLLHGLGFAGALAELGLPRSEFLAALVSFNLGVEAGQMAVVAAAFGALAAWTGAARLGRRTLAVPASAVIACMGIYWTVLRVMR